MSEEMMMKFALNNRSSVAVIALAAGLTVAQTSHAAFTAFTWDGGSLVDSNFGTAANWNPDGVPAQTIVSGNEPFYVFDGNLRTSVVNNRTSSLTNSVVIGGYVFAATAGSFTINPAAGTRGADLQPGVIVGGEPYSGNAITQLSPNAQVVNDRLFIRGNLAGNGAGLVTLTTVGGSSNNISKTGSSTYYLDDNDGVTFGGGNRFLTISGGTYLTGNTTGSGTGLNSISVQTGGTLGGDGVITPGVNTTRNDVNVNSGGRLSPGIPTDSTTTLTFAMTESTGTGVADLNLVSGSLFTFDLGSTAAGASDRIAITAGNLALNSQVFSNFTFNALPGFGAGVYTLFDVSGTGTATGALGAGLTGTIGGFDAVLGRNGPDVILTVSVIPEPASLGAVVLGSALLIGRRRRA
jgi:fibronectin-binding autotransporter adhesin